jgi:peptide/nickel transport system ATP-binding protein
MMPGICDSEVPPFKDMGNGHVIACHLSDDELNAMLPVIEVEAAPAAE